MKALVLSTLTVLLAASPVLAQRSINPYLALAESARMDAHEGKELCLMTIAANPQCRIFVRDVYMKAADAYEMYCHSAHQKWACTERDKMIDAADKFYTRPKYLIKPGYEE